MTCLFCSIGNYVLRSKTRFLVTVQPSQGNKLWERRNTFLLLPEEKECLCDFMKPENTKWENLNPENMKLESLKPEIQEGIRRHIHRLGGTERAEIIEVGPGHAKIAVDIRSDCLNLYGKVHGGFLFTLCDTVSGMAAYCLEQMNVTQDSSIQFLHGISEGRIYVEANALHSGKRTAVNRVTVTSEDGTLLANASFTMCLLGPLSKFNLPWLQADN